MNWLLLGVILFVGIFCYRGWSLGIIKSIFMICSTILALIITGICNPMVSNIICSNEKIVNTTANVVSNTMGLHTSDTDAVDSVNKKEQNEKIEALPLSKSIKTQLKKNNNQKVYQSLFADTFEEYLAKYIAIMILNISSFLIIFVVIRIGIFILAKMLDIISKLPVIKQMDQMAGLLLGGLQGVLILWIACIGLMLFSGSAFSKAVYEYIDNSIILTFLYDHNLLMILLTNFMSSIQLGLLSLVGLVGKSI